MQSSSVKSASIQTGDKVVVDHKRCYDTHKHKIVIKYYDLITTNWQIVMAQWNPSIEATIGEGMSQR